MIFPIGDDQVQGGKYPIFSYSFIVINILVFVLLQSGDDAFTYANSAIPFEITTGQDFMDDVPIPQKDGTYRILKQTPGPTPIYLTLLFSIFMHGGWAHLIGNMVFLWVFADNIESTVGWTRFLIFYLAAGIVASLFHIYSDASSVIPSLGASGAIAGCLGAYLVMFPKSRVKVFAFFSLVHVPAYLFLGFWIYQQFTGVMGASSSGVAWWAHIGGLIFGVLIGLIFKFRFPKVVKKDVGYASVIPEQNRYNNRNITNRF